MRRSKLYVLRITKLKQKNFLKIFEKLLTKLKLYDIITIPNRKGVKRLWHRHQELH